MGQLPGRHLLSQRLLCGLMLAALWPATALAQYKVVGPDGKVTYTDRPPAQSQGKLVPVPSGSTGNTASNAALPLALRQAVSRYPVVLYAPRTCEVCETSRQFLRQRGIPYADKLLSTSEDGDALERITGSRSVPTLTVGNQVLKGFSADNWASYLNAAGYPPDSRLPPGYVQAAPTPLVAASPVDRNIAAPARPRDEPPPATAPATPGGIRF